MDAAIAEFSRISNPTHVGGRTTPQPTGAFANAKARADRAIADFAAEYSAAFADLPKDARPAQNVEAA